MSDLNIFSKKQQNHANRFFRNTGNRKQTGREWSRVKIILVPRADMKNRGILASNIFRKIQFELRLRNAAIKTLIWRSIAVLLSLFFKNNE
jgi:hypothetical protein